MQWTRHSRYTMRPGPVSFSGNGVFRKTEQGDGLSEGRVAAGGEDVDWFDAFFQAEHRRLYGTLCLVTGNRQEAEELMQEAFLRLWERRDSIGNLDDPAAYLYRTAFNLFRNRVRRMVRAARRVLLASPSADAFAVADERQDLFAALRELAPRQRAAVVLTDLMDMTSEEAGRLLGIRPGTARALAYQARRALRASMSPERSHDE
jgi:RNA polymerase sigma-70 factor, ECF subfamily